MKKTFYTVRYAIWGASYTSTAWFDNLADAKKFAADDYCDTIAVRTFTNPEKIKEAEREVDLTAYEKSCPLY